MWNPNNFWQKPLPLQNSLTSGEFRDTLGVFTTNCRFRHTLVFYHQLWIQIQVVDFSTKIQIHWCFYQQGVGLPTCQPQSPTSAYFCKILLILAYLELSIKACIKNELYSLYFTILITTVDLRTKTINPNWETT